jgi:hypothetical protein
MQLSALSVCEPSWTSSIIQGYDNDSCTQDILTKISVARQSVPNFSLKDGIVRFKDRVWAHQATLCMEKYEE